jgi:hypothetical protein
LAEISAPSTAGRDALHSLRVLYGLLAAGPAILCVVVLLVVALGLTQPVSVEAGHTLIGVWGFVSAVTVALAFIAWRRALRPLRQPDTRRRVEAGEFSVARSVVLLVVTGALAVAPAVLGCLVYLLFPTLELLTTALLLFLGQLAVYFPRAGWFAALS